MFNFACYLKIIAITTNIAIAAPINGKKATTSEKTIGTMKKAATNNIAKLNTSLTRSIAYNPYLN